MKYLKMVLPVVVLASLTFACAPQLPQTDVDTATAAFNDAKTSKADLYAADSWKAASDANDSLQANLTAKDYGKTKDLAKALLDTANKAKADAATGLDAAKSSVTSLGADVTALIPVVQQELALAQKAGKKAQIDLKPIKDGLADASNALTAAQAEAEPATAAAALTTLKTNLQGFQSTLEGAGFKAQ